MDRNRQLESFRKKLSKIAPTGHLESLGRVGMEESMTEGVLENLMEPQVEDGVLDRRLTGRQNEQAVDIKTSALRKMENGDFDDISPSEELILEAIVEEVGRPVSFIQGGKFSPLPDPWTHFNDPSKSMHRHIHSAIPSIGRVEVPSAGPGEAPIHLGTGFIVGSNLMMTNRHVAELFIRGVGRNRKRLSFVPGTSTAIDFKREKDFSPADRSGSVAIVDIVMVHPFWDMALFQVENLPAGVGSLALSVLAPEDLAEREIAVIGYPARSRDRSLKAVELEQKHFGTIFGVKRLAPGEIREREQIESFKHFVPAMIHDSSTLPGNSGSAILDVMSGNIVGLHFAGITLKANYSVPTFELARDSRVVDAGVRFEGRLPPPTADWESFWGASDPERESGLATGGNRSVFSIPNQPGPVMQNNSATWTIPLSVSVSLGTPTLSMAAPAPSGATPVTTASPATLGLIEASFQTPVIHDHLESRTGYDPDFLKLGGGKTVPLPQLTLAGQAAVSTLVDGSFILKYHRFSVVQHKKRRLALFTAANVNWQRTTRLVDGRKPSRQDLTGIPDGVLEEWVVDERIPANEQLPDMFFTKDKGAFDKGHLVRRDDVAWGNSFLDMQKGNGDTYHTTNCSPQVGIFNQSARGVDNWGDLENMIQKQTSAERVIIFSGPVLATQDRIFKGIAEGGMVKVQIPSQFWKIVVAKTPSGPKAFGFVLKQKLTAVPLEFAVPEDWEPFQTPIQEIEGLLFGLAKLDWFKEHDALNA